MNNICENIQTIKNTLIIFKYIIPIIFIMIGFIKLVITTKTKKAIKNFIVYITIAIFIFLIAILGQKVINNKCDEYNKKEKPEYEEKEPINIEPTIDETPVQTSIKEENKIENIDGVTYIDGILVVNKTYSLPESFTAPNSNGYGYCLTCLTDETINAFNEMKADAQSIDLTYIFHQDTDHTHIKKPYIITM